MPTPKPCPCGEADFKAFYPSSLRNGIWRCRACVNKQSTARHNKLCGSQSGRDTLRRYQLKCYYGITPEQYKQLTDLHAGMCHLCRARPHEAIDHCHLTGRVRGLLCKTCNTGLGLLGDTAETLARALTYVQSEGIPDSRGRRRRRNAEPGRDPDDRVPDGDG